jgi:hypothetical protein
MDSKKGRACLGMLLLLLMGAAKLMPAASPPRSFWGCWVVTKMLPTPGLSGLSQKQVNGILGTRLVFTPSCARSGRTVARSPEYSTTVLSDRDFFKLGNVSLRQIGVATQQVTRVGLVKPELSDLVFLGDYVFLRSEDIVLEVEGDFFVAERAKAGDAACVCETRKVK